MLGAGMASVAGQSRYVTLYLLLLGAIELFWGPTYPFPALCSYSALVFPLLLRAQFLMRDEQNFILLSRSFRLFASYSFRYSSGPRFPWRSWGSSPCPARL